MVELNNILNERQNSYGKFSDNAKIARFLKLETTFLFKNTDPCVFEGAQQIFSKISRVIVGDWGHKDSWIDIKGYIIQSERFFNIRNVEFEKRIHKKYIQKKLKLLNEGLDNFFEEFNVDLILCKLIEGIVIDLVNLVYNINCKKYLCNKYSDLYNDKKNKVDQNIKSIFSNIQTKCGVILNCIEYQK